MNASLTSVASAIRVALTVGGASVLDLIINESGVSMACASKRQAVKVANLLTLAGCIDVHPYGLSGEWFVCASFPVA